MEIRKLILSVLIVICIIALFSFGAYNGIKSSGYDNGYQEGGISSLASGYADGFNTGYYIVGTDAMVSALPTAFGYVPIERHKISVEELKTFLKEDSTDSLKVADDFNCLGYAFTLKANSDKVGIVCGVVMLYFDKEQSDHTAIENMTGHALNAFYVRFPRKVVDTSFLGIQNSPPLIIEERDGIVFVEPQTDQLVDNLPIGSSYSVWFNGVYKDALWWQDNTFNATYLKEDMIREINIFWGSPYENQLDYGGSKR
jgi:hypothetical protein